MAHCDDNQSQAAALLGISRHTLRTQLANLGLIKAAAARLRRRGAFANAAGADRELRIGYQRFGSLGILKARQSPETAFASLGVNVLWSEFPAGPQLPPRPRLQRDRLRHHRRSAAGVCPGQQ